MKIEPENLDPQRMQHLLGRFIAPRPLVFISTVGEDGVFNAAPFGFACPVCVKPPTICVSFGLRKGQKKDTLRNIESVGDFVVNVVDETLVKAAHQASANYPSGVDEIKEVGLTAVASAKVRSPRIAESPANLECRLVNSLELGEGPNSKTVVFGEVVMLHVRDDVMVDGKVEIPRLKLIGLLSGVYCRIGDIFELERPHL